MLSKITPVLDAIRWEQGNINDAPVTVILRSQLLDWACSLGAPTCTTLSTTYVTALAGPEATPYANI